MVNKKIGITLAVIVIASIFAMLPFPMAVQAGDGFPPTPPVNDNGNITRAELNSTNFGATLRVYGEDDMGPIYGYGAKGQFIYRNWTDPFDPAVLLKDVLIFNPAVVYDGEYASMYASGKDIDVKKYLRVWYEPAHVYTKPSYVHETIEVETTYMLVENQDGDPWHGEPGVTAFVFPIAEKQGQTGLGSFENEGLAAPFQYGTSGKYTTSLKGVWANEQLGTYNKTVNGTIVLEKDYWLNLSQEVQFLDHKLQYNYVVKTNSNTYWAVVTVKYAGNLEDDTARTVTLGEFDGPWTTGNKLTTYFDRHNNRYPTASHVDHRTWYAQFDGTFSPTYQAHIYLGKELSANDTFYVNAVRYDVPAIEVLDTNISAPGADAFKYITLRTPLPKYTASVLWPDDGKVSSQWIDTIAPLEVIPLNPPFNEPHHVIDDINVVLWDDDATDWPCGTYDGPESVGFTYFPWAERYLTMQYEEIIKDVFDVAGENGMNNVPVGANWYSHFSPTPINRNWFKQNGQKQAGDLAWRDVGIQPALRFAYVENDFEPRFTTTKLEKLYEIFPEPSPPPTEPPEETWTWFDIKTRPNDYVEFALPAQDDLENAQINKTGDYLLASAFLAPNSLGRSDLGGYLVEKTPLGIPKMAFAFDVRDEEDVCPPTIKMGDGLDLYVNSYGDTASSIRIYGEEDIGPINDYGVHGTYKYPADDYQAPFKPQAIRKDSITFNPAIIEWDGAEYPMSAIDPFRQSKDIDVKKYLRLWYEPEHRYAKNVVFNPEVEFNYTYPTIEIESTYLLIDSQDKDPIDGWEGYTFFAFPIAANWSTTEIKGLEEFENPLSPGLIPTDGKNVVKVAAVDGTVDMYNKTTWGKISLEKTYRMPKDTTIQFLGHELTYLYPDNEDNISVSLAYIGHTSGPDYVKTQTLYRWNTYFDRHNVVQSVDDPPAARWYARHAGYAIPGEEALITVGIELDAGDVFYVDGVRYDVPAIEVIDGDGNASNGPELFKYITLRTPLPKRDGITVDTPTVPDEEIVWSQSLWTYEPGDILPVDPPFNKMHWIVDDIDVCPATYPKVAQRIIGPYAPLEIKYIAETIEPRYSSNLMQILAETVTGSSPIVEGWTKFEVITRPDEYTEFVLPGDIARYDWVNRTWAKPLHNDYLVTTSFLANNSIGLADPGAEDLSAYGYNIPRAAFVYDVINTKGIYVNEITGLPPLPTATLNVTCSVTPTETPSGFPVTACVTVPTAQANFPVQVTINWGDGSQNSVGVLPNNSVAICFNHIYYQQGFKNITQTAKDIFGNTGVNASTSVNVTNDGFKLVVGPGWNFFSIPVNKTGGTMVSDIFGPVAPVWLTTVYRWDEDAQNWETLGWGDYVYPKYGYFVWGPAMGPEEFIVTGNNEPFDDSWWSAYSGKWIAVGPGYQPQNIAPETAYTWLTWYYGTTQDLLVGNGYFIWV